MTIEIGLALAIATFIFATIPRTVMIGAGIAVAAE